MATTSFKIDSKHIVITKKVRLYDSIHPLELVCGKMLAPVDVVFETYGELSPARDNAVLIIHALTGSAHAAFWNHPEEKEPGWWNGIIGPGKAFDTDRYFVICSNLLGGCYGTTGPNSISLQTGERYGEKFPEITTIDMARVLKKLLDYLQVSYLVTVAGGSLGGMIVWQMAVQYPELSRSVIPIAGTLAASPWVIGLNEVARQAIFLDPDWHKKRSNGNKPGSIAENGLRLARMIAMISYRSELSFEQRFRRDRIQAEEWNNFNPANRFQVENYLHYQGNKLVQRFDPFTYITLTRAMDWHDVASGYNNLSDALDQIKANVLSVGIDTDRLFTAREMRKATALLQKLGKTAHYDEIQSIHGHDAFLIEFKQLNQIIRSFLESL